MVASNQVGSYIAKFLADAVFVLLHPRDGPSVQDLSWMGYERIARKRRGLSSTEIWIGPVLEEGSEARDIKTLEHRLSGFFRVDSHRTHFHSMDDARAYFTQYGITDEQFQSILEPHIITSATYRESIPVREAVQLHLPF